MVSKYLAKEMGVDKWSTVVTNIEQIKNVNLVCNPIKHKIL